MWIRGHLNRIARFNHPTADYPGEDAFFGHDTPAHLAKYGTTGVAVLANLSDLEENPVPHTQHCSNRKGGKINSFGGKVFCKGAWPDLEAHSHHFVYTLHRQQTHLPMAAAVGMRIVHKSMVFPDEGRVNHLFRRALGIAPAHGQYSRHHFPGLTYF
jgi:hypothetical protein